VFQGAWDRGSGAVRARDTLLCETRANPINPHLALELVWRRSGNIHGTLALFQSQTSVCASLSGREQIEHTRSSSSSTSSKFTSTSSNQGRASQPCEASHAHGAKIEIFPNLFHHNTAPTHHRQDSAHRTRARWPRAWFGQATRREGGEGVLQGAWDRGSVALLPVRDISLDFAWCNSGTSNPHLALQLVWERDSRCGTLSCNRKLAYKLRCRDRSKSST